MLCSCPSYSISYCGGVSYLLYSLLHMVVTCRTRGDVNVNVSVIVNVLSHGTCLYFALLCLSVYLSPCAPFIVVHRRAPVLSSLFF